MNDVHMLDIEEKLFELKLKETICFHTKYPFEQ